MPGLCFPALKSFLNPFLSTWCLLARRLLLSPSLSSNSHVYVTSAARYSRELRIKTFPMRQRITVASLNPELICRGRSGARACDCKSGRLISFAISAAARVFLAEAEACAMLWIPLLCTLWTFFTVSSLGVGKRAWWRSTAHTRAHVVEVEVKKISVFHKKATIFVDYSTKNNSNKILDINPYNVPNIYDGNVMF